ncbi:MAG: methyltransferase domain-containing protein [Spirochaetales bacterium]
MRDWLLTHRSNESELMDDPSGDQEMLFRTLRQFSLINRLLTGNRRLLKTHVLKPLRPGDQEVRFLDVGAGGGDTARWLADEARRRNINIRIVCLDHDERVARYCEQECRDYPEILTRCGSFEAVEEPFDFVFCNHLIHHLDAEGVRRFLDHTHTITSRLFLASDLRRSAPAIAGFRLLSTLAFRNSFARSDGATSIRRAFRARELRRIIAESSWGDRAIVRTGVPARLVVIASAR